METDPEQDDQWRELAKLEAALGLLEGFTWQLYQQGDDWRFIVMMHAFVESATSELLALHFDDAVLDTILQLPFNGRASKIQLLSDLHDVPKEYLNFIKQLSKLRNRLAHNVRNFRLTVRGYVAGLSQQEKVAFRNAMRPWVAEHPVAPDGVSLTRDDFIMECPREAMFYGATRWLEVLQLIRSVEEKKAELSQLRSRIDDLGPPDGTDPSGVS